MFANMVEAQEAPAARAVEIGWRHRSLIFAWLAAAGDRAAIARAFDPAVHSGITRCQLAVHLLRLRFLARSTAVYRRQ